MNDSIEKLMNDIINDMENYKEAWEAFGDNPHTAGRATAMNIAQRLVKRHFEKFKLECPNGCCGTLNDYELVEMGYDK